MIALIGRIPNHDPGAGKIVETKYGIGRTYNSEESLNGKVKVYFTNGKKMLISPSNMKLMGYID